MLLVIQTSTVLAFRYSSEKEITERTSSSTEDNHSEKKSCCDNDEKEDDGFCGACENPSCHCPSTVNLPVDFNHFELSHTNSFTLLVSDMTYIQHIPKAVYLSIWQPPEIS